MAKQKYQQIKDYWVGEINKVIQETEVQKHRNIPWQENLENYGEIAEIETCAHGILNDIWTEYEEIWENKSMLFNYLAKNQKPSYPINNEEYTAILNAEITDENNEQQEDINDNVPSEDEGESSSAAQAQQVPISVSTTPEPPEVIELEVDSQKSEDDEDESNQTENNEPEWTYSTVVSSIHNLLPEIFSFYEE